MLLGKKNKKKINIIYKLIISKYFKIIYNKIKSINIYLMMIFNIIYIYSIATLYLILIPCASFAHLVTVKRLSKIVSSFSPSAVLYTIFEVLELGEATQAHIIGHVVYDNSLRSGASDRVAVLLLNNLTSRLDL